MIKKALIIAFVASASSLSSYAGEKNSEKNSERASGKLEVLSVSDDKPLNQAQVGNQIKIRVSGQDGSHCEREQLVVRYTFSVVPEGSNTPITLSGKLSMKAADAQVIADQVGPVIYEIIYQIPNFIPAGIGSLSISGDAANAGSVTLDKTLKLVL